MMNLAIKQKVLNCLCYAEFSHTLMNSGYTMVKELESQTFSSWALVVNSIVVASFDCLGALKPKTH